MKEVCIEVKDLYKYFEEVKAVYLFCCGRYGDLGRVKECKVHWTRWYEDSAVLNWKEEINF